jgi:hypothetical protein
LFKALLNIRSRSALTGSRNLKRTFEGGSLVGRHSQFLGRMPQLG